MTAASGAPSTRASSSDSIVASAVDVEKAASIKIVDYRMVGATGRLYLSGTDSEVRAAAAAAEQALEMVA